MHYLIFQTSGSNFNPSSLIPMFLIWILILIGSLILISKKKLSRTISIIILSVALIVSGLILNATPNPILPIQQIILVGSSRAPVSTILQTILPFIVILLVLLTTGLLFGRIFCGYACPLGAYQELLSKFLFKSKITPKSKKKYTIKLNARGLKWFRAGFFVVFAILLIIFGQAVVQYVNPFTTFKIFHNPSTIMITIPLIILILIGLTSIFIYRPWCRLFCPFGTLVSLTSSISQIKLQRNNNCIDCGLCEKVCPTDEAFRASSKAECYLCNRCIDICPHNAIDLQKMQKNKK